MKRLFILLGLVCSLSLFAQDDEVIVGGVLLEAVIPGYHAIQNGDWTGWLTAPSALLGSAGQAYQFYKKDGLDITSSALDATAFLFSSYYNFSFAYRAIDYSLENGSALSLGECMTSPFTPTGTKDILAASVLGVVALTAYRDKGAEFSAYFNAASVRLWGMDMNPYAALGAVIGASAAISLFSTTTEELISREWILGDVLPSLGLDQTSSLLISSAVFSSIHLGNLLFVKPTWENVQPILWQTGLAFLQGGILGYIYQSDTSANHKEGLQKAIMYHFWNNVLAFSLNYVVAQGKEAEKTQAQKDAEKLSMEHPSPWQITTESYPPSIGVEYRY